MLIFAWKFIAPYRAYSLQTIFIQHVFSHLISSEKSERVGVVILTLRRALTPEMLMELRAEWDRTGCLGPAGSPSLVMWWSQAGLRWPECGLGSASHCGELPPTGPQLPYPQNRREAQEVLSSSKILILKQVSSWEMENCLSSFSLFEPPDFFPEKR